MASKLDREPVAAAAGFNVVVQAAMQLLVAFNVPLTTVQIGAITTFVLVFTAWWARGKVFAPVDAQGQPLTVLRPAPDFTPQSLERTSTPPPPPATHRTPAELLEDYKRRQHHTE